MPRDPKKRKTNVPTEHIPRPANCFMIFRADWLRNSIANSPRGDGDRQKQKDVSQEAAAAWNSLSPTLKQLYKVQANIVKEEHGKKYPGWVYQPRALKKKKSAADDAPPDGSSTKRVARGRTVAPYQKPSPDVKGKREAKATPFTQISASKELIWDGTWFSGSSSMKDPFYFTPLQSLASVSPPSTTRDVNVTHLTKESPTAPPPVPHFFPPPAQVHGFGMVPNFYAMPSMHHHNSGIHNPERHDHNGLTPASGALNLSAFRPLPQATALTEPPASSGPQIVPQNQADDSIPAAGSSVNEVPTPKSETEPPTQALAKSSHLSYDNLLESYYNNDDWEFDPAFNPDFDPFSSTRL